MDADSWMAKRVPSFADEFDDDTAPKVFAGPDFPPVATHSSEIQHLFDQPNAPFASARNANQEALAASMRTAWTTFAATGNPSAPGAPWPSVNTDSAVLSLLQPQPRPENNFTSVHHCTFWGAG